ncbi:mannose-P-dolichol utilization defect 1 protein-like [Varroa jacobsoni]|uniref:mannose-P-dolichol utilization defect 1 protein-like n=1 Tax=Varroa jacobsoni TaxID=62625 RepID=UPI000BF95EBA|nr:mannose-P-dolichol utilization defect 1 protein-like [Varroa jacobsoni]
MELLRPFFENMFPGRCFDSLVLNWNIQDVQCLKMVLAKCLGYAMVVGGALVKLPQIVKIISAASATGLSLPSVLLDLAGVTATTAYNFDQQYPFSAYGEGAFLMAETILILCLALHYSGRGVLAATFIVAYAALCSSLFIYRLAPSSTLLWGQLLSAPIVIAGRLWQAFDNYKAGHTGQLSLVTQSLLFIGCLARIFTTLTETGDIAMTLSYSLASVANAILVVQVLYYWEATNCAVSKDNAKKSA